MNKYKKIEKRKHFLSKKSIFFHHHRRHRRSLFRKQEGQINRQTGGTHMRGQTLTLHVRAFCLHCTEGMKTRGVYRPGESGREKNICIFLMGSFLLFFFDALWDEEI